MVGLSFVAVAICYVGSFAIANEEVDTTRTFKGDLVLFEKLAAESAADQMKKDIEKTLNGKDKEEVYNRIKKFHGRIKDKCSVFANGISEVQSSIGTSDDLFKQLKGLLKALERKCNDLRGIALNMPDDHGLIAKWLEDSGIVKKEEGVNTEICRNDLRKCYRTFFHYINGLEKALGITPLTTLPNPDADEHNEDYFDEDDESDHDDCGHPDHADHLSTRPPNYIITRFGPNSVVRTQTNTRENAPTSSSVSGSTHTSQTTRQTGDHNTVGTAVSGNAEQASTGEVQGTDNEVNSSTTQNGEESGPTGAMGHQKPTTVNPGPSTVQTVSRATETEAREETPVGPSSTTGQDNVQSGPKPTQTEAGQEPSASDPPSTAAPTGKGSEKPVQEQVTNIRGEQPTASQQSQAYIPLFATAVATVLVSVF